MATADPLYLEQIHKNFSYYHYKVIIIYPFTYNTNILFERSLQRGLKEGRFIRCSGIHSLEDNIIINITTYNKYIIPNYSFYRYNTNISLDHFNEFKEYNFSNLNKYTLSYRLRDIEHNINMINDDKVIKCKAHHHIN